MSDPIYRVNFRDIRPRLAVAHSMTVGAPSARRARAMVQRHAGALLARRGTPIEGVLVIDSARRDRDLERLAEEKA